MILDARTLPDGATIQADVCIVGAGAAGIAIARELISTGAGVALFESGGLEPDRAAQALNGGQSNNPYDHALDKSRFRIFGGTTSQWSGWCRALDPADFERRDWIPESGWPISRADLDPYYERARDLCEISRTVKERAGSGPQKCLDLESPLITSHFDLSPPTKFGNRYRDELSSAANISVYLNATAISFRTSETSERIDAIEFRTLTNTSIVASAKVFILATGGVENARLLLASREKRRHALGNEHDLVGRFYMDHLAFFSGIMKPVNGSAPFDFYTTPFDGRPAAVGPVSGAITFAERALQERKILGAVLRFVRRPAFSLTDEYNSPATSSARRIVDSIWSGRIPDDARTHFAHTATGVAKVATVASQAVAHALRPRTRFAVRCLAETAPNRDNRVALAKPRDALGLELPTITWNVGALERRSMTELHHEFSKQSSRIGLGSVSPINDGFEPPWLTGASHHIGTTRMHDSPRHGVVDRNCRVHGIGNLYIAGSSVFPTCGYANPTLTIIALAIRLADLVKAAVQPGSGSLQTEGRR